MADEILKPIEMGGRDALSNEQNPQHLVPDGFHHPTDTGCGLWWVDHSLTNREGSEEFDEYAISAERTWRRFPSGDP
ncbi:MAG: hypothetical protein MK077_03130 [Phycisphaerales bacterium]|nr:hypothetical protein [Phycisphaerales bacterium]